MASLAEVLEKLSQKLDKITQSRYSEGQGIFETMRGLGARAPGLHGPPTSFQAMMSGSMGSAIRAMGAGGRAASTIGAIASGGGMGAISGRMMASGNPYVMAAGAIVKFATSMIEGVEKLRNWNEALHNSNRQFADFSGQMALVMAEDDARTIQLKREQGDRRAETARELAEAKSRLDRRVAPIEDWFANLKNKIGTTVSDVIVNTMDKLGIGAGPDGDRTGHTAGAFGAMPANEWMAFLRDEQAYIEKRRPERFK